MRKISAMYQYSGGTNYKHACGECSNLITVRKGSRATYKCLAYGRTDGHESDWKNTSMACKGFNKKPPSIPVLFQSSKAKICDTSDALPGQMTIFDYPEALPCKQ